MTLETANYIADLNASYPESASGVAGGDDHLRLMKAVLLASFPSIDGAVTLTDTELNLLSGLTAAAAELNKLAGFTGNVGTVTSITGGTGLTGGAITTTGTLAIDKASTGEVRNATADKVLTADHLSAASALVTLSDASTIAVNWKAFIVGQVTLTANRVLGNPSNGIPGTTRQIVIKGNSGTLRTLTFGAQYLGAKPVIENVTSSVWQLLTITCLATDHFVVSARRAKG